MSRFEEVQAAQLAILLDALDGVPLSYADRRTLKWLSGWERDSVENLAAVIQRARRNPTGGTQTARPAIPLPWDLQVNDAVRAVFPAAVAEDIIADDAIGALHYRLREQCDASGQSPAEVLGALPGADRDFCARAERPAAFLTNRIRDGAW